jgi:hypothetical protein
MSWNLSLAGKSSKLAEVIKEKFVGTGGCPKGSAEEAAKNALGDVAETLCKSFASDMVVSIMASGSAWNEGDKARSQQCKFEFATHGNFVE